MQAGCNRQSGSGAAAGTLAGAVGGGVAKALRLPRAGPMPPGAWATRAEGQAPPHGRHGAGGTAAPSARSPPGPSAGTLADGRHGAGGVRADTSPGLAVGGRREGCGRGAGGLPGCGRRGRWRRVRRGKNGKATPTKTKSDPPQNGQGRFTERERERERERNNPENRKRNEGSLRGCGTVRKGKPFRVFGGLPTPFLFGAGRRRETVGGRAGRWGSAGRFRPDGMPGRFPDAVGGHGAEGWRGIDGPGSGRRTGWPGASGERCRKRSAARRREGRGRDAGGSAGGWAGNVRRPSPRSPSARAARRREGWPMGKRWPGIDGPGLAARLVRAGRWGSGRRRAGRESMGRGWPSAPSAGDAEALARTARRGRWRRAGGTRTDGQGGRGAGGMRTGWPMGNACPDSVAASLALPDARCGADAAGGMHGQPGRQAPRMDGGGRQGGGAARRRRNPGAFRAFRFRRGRWPGLADGEAVGTGGGRAGRERPGIDGPGTFAALPPARRRHVAGDAGRCRPDGMPGSRRRSPSAGPLPEASGESMGRGWPMGTRWPGFRRRFPCPSLAPWGADAAGEGRRQGRTPSATHGRRGAARRGRSPSAARMGRGRSAGGMRTGWPMPPGRMPGRFPDALAGDVAGSGRRRAGRGRSGRSDAARIPSPFACLSLALPDARCGADAAGEDARASPDAKRPAWTAGRGKAGPLAVGTVGGIAGRWGAGGTPGHVAGNAGGRRTARGKGARVHKVQTGSANRGAVHIGCIPPGNVGTVGGTLGTVGTIPAGAASPCTSARSAPSAERLARFRHAWHDSAGAVAPPLRMPCKPFSSPPPPPGLGSAGRSPSARRRGAGGMRPGIDGPGPFAARIPPPSLCPLPCPVRGRCRRGGCTASPHAKPPAWTARGGKAGPGNVGTSPGPSPGNRWGADGTRAGLAVAAGESMGSAGRSPPPERGRHGGRDADGTAGGTRTK